MGQPWQCRSCGRICRSHRGGDGAFFLKTHGGAPVGFAQCQLRRDYVAEVRGFARRYFVREAYRRRGFAGELLAACEAGRVQGCVSLPAIADTSNAPAVWRFTCAQVFRG
ncbi:MAG: GNAT family N-acetyltransferase [Oscillospiraceae bacterium]